MAKKYIENKMIFVLVVFMVMTMILVPLALAEEKSWTLTEDEIDNMLFIREEEKLAHDVYHTLYAKWGLQVFDRIIESEQTHTEAIKKLIIKYGLVDPYKEGIGEFTNTEIADLYDCLTERGLESPIDAVLVGGFIEEYDILDLREAIDDTEKTDITKVYESLKLGSYNHLDAFVYQYEEKIAFEDYVPELMEEDDFEDVLNSVDKGSQKRKN